MAAKFFLADTTDGGKGCSVSLCCSSHKLTEGFPKAPSGTKTSNWAEWFGIVRGWLVITDQGQMLYREKD